MSRLKKPKSFLGVSTHSLCFSANTCQVTLFLGFYYRFKEPVQVFSHGLSQGIKKPIENNNKIIDKNYSDTSLCLQLPLRQSQGSLFCLLLCRNTEKSMMCTWSQDSKHKSIFLMIKAHSWGCCNPGKPTNNNCKMLVSLPRSLG